MQSPSELVFVYGTLMRGQANHRVLEGVGARLAGMATTAEPRTLVDLGPYPALLIRGAADATPVVGELYRVNAEAMATLDVFEGCPELYTRESVSVVLDGGEAFDAWTYVLAPALPAHAVVIDGGRYRGGGVVLAVDAREREAEAVEPPLPHGPGDGSDID